MAQLEAMDSAASAAEQLHPQGGVSILRRQITKGEMKMTIGHEHMMVYAARYAHRRQTGAALQVVNHILAEWDKLTENTKWKLYEESREAMYCQEDWQKLRDKYEEEHLCCNCVYELPGSMPSCAMDMRHGEACRFFELRKIN